MVSGYSRIGSSTHHHVLLCSQKVRKFLLLVPIIAFVLCIATLGGFMVSQFLYRPHDKCHIAAPSPESSTKDSFSHGPKAIAAACNYTTLTRLCVSSLLSYPGALRANPPQLVAISLKIALREANASYMLAVNLSKEQGNGIEIAAVTDCVELMDDAIDQLNISISPLLNLDMHAPTPQIKDVQTWVSAALTFTTTCSDGFDNPKGPIAVRMTKKADDLSKRISIGLALVAHLGEHLSSWKNSTVLMPPSGMMSQPCH